jgi:hypothetical protein
MSPNPASSGKEQLITDDEEVLQAVILADSFNKRFKPLTTHKPRVSHTIQRSHTDLIAQDTISAFCPYVMLHCWTGHSKASLWLVFKRSL